MLACQAQVLPKGFFFGRSGRTPGVLSTCIGGVEEKTPSVDTLRLGPGLSVRDQDSLAGRGGTNSQMNESLPSGHLGVDS
jgi:hypothetical protein